MKCDKNLAGGRLVSALQRWAIVIVCVCSLSFSGDHASAITDCSVAYTLTPDSAAKAECTTTPCNPGNCVYTPPSDGTGAPTTGLGTFSTACGPITKCVYSGDDPPLSSPYWDEPLSGFQGLGATLMSGRCAPPKAADRYELMCPAAGYIPSSR